MFWCVFRLMRLCVVSVQYRWALCGMLFLVCVRMFVCYFTCLCVVCDVLCGVVWFGVFVMRLSVCVLFLSECFCYL